MDQARQIDPNFGAFYIFRDQQGNLNIVNTLNERALRVHYTGDDIEYNINLFSEDTRVEGEICVSGIPCSAAGASLSEYDSAYFNIDDIPLENINILRFELLGPGGTILGSFDPPIEEFTSLTYTMSEREIDISESLLPPNTEVSIRQY